MALDVEHGVPETAGAPAGSAEDWVWWGGELSRIGAPEIGAGAYRLVFLGVPHEHESAMNSWYDEEHVPSLCAVTGVRGAMRFRAPVAQPPFLAVYALSSLEVCSTEEWKNVGQSVWSQAIRPKLRDRYICDCVNDG